MNKNKKTKNNKNIYSILKWFKEPSLKHKEVIIKQNQIVINAFTVDLIISVLIMSVLVNLYWLSSWILFQVDPISRNGIIQLLFM